MAIIGQALPQPEDGWVRFDDRNRLIEYIGTGWTLESVTGYYNSTVTNSSRLNDSLEFSFIGTQFRIIDATATNRSADVIISIDGVEEHYSGYSTATVRAALLYEKTGLSNSIHKVKITNIASGYLALDAIDINEGGELIRTDYEDNLDAPELMRKYGISWFKFDEEDGNALDFFPTGFEGTHYNVTRTEDWKQDGHSISYTGSSSSYTNFNNPLTPLGEKTLRFKFKHAIQPSNANNAHVLFTNSPNSGSNGILVSINGAVGLNVTYAKGDTSYTTNIITNKFYNDDKWTQFHLSWDGEVGSNLYLKVGDDEFVVKNSYAEAQGFSNNARLARGVGTNAFPAKVAIDDLQLYAKVLKPEDFEDKSVVVQYDEKTYSIPNKNGRVKEILNATDEDILNQGYSWDEIESATTEDDMILTTPTTEYEVVNNEYTTLGNGKMFTLPISNFKIAKIENNY